MKETLRGVGKDFGARAPRAVSSVPRGTSWEKKKERVNMSHRQSPLEPPVQAAVIVASDRGSRGEREDKSGVLIQERLEAMGAIFVQKRILPDNEDSLCANLASMADDLGLDLIVTTGGTGFTARDVMPEATARIVDRPVPGIPEAIRAEGLKKTPYAMLSRGIAGIRGRTLVVNLPGSIKGVQDGMNVLERIIDHAVETLRSTAGVECG